MQQIFNYNLISGVAPNGQPRSILVSSDGRLLVDGSGVTQPVTIATLPALATGTNTIGAISNTSFAATQSGTWNVANITGTVSLPTGAATSALQSTTNASLASIDTKTPALGQALASGSTPVVLPAAQITALTPPTSVGINNSITLAAESGYLNYRNTALTNTAVQVKASGGSVMGWNFINPNSVTVYVKFYNLATGVTVGTSPILLTQAVPGGSASNPGINFLDVGLIPQEVFSTGISIACVTGLADNNNTAPTTPIHASVRYK